ncbi:MAG: AAA family ATPase [Myxococcales bacterium]
MLHTFLDFELDEERCELRLQGQPIPVQGRVFDLIVLLVHARERVVSRDELMHGLWQGAVVSDAAVSQIIMLARKALGDEGESQQVIKTVRGKGIRFVADVQSRAGALTRPSGDVLGARASTQPPVAEAIARPPSRLLGRADELAALLARLERAELGHGGLMLIEGEPGMGKSALAEELAVRAQERGVAVLWGRAWEDGGAPPFWPWIQVLRAIAQREGQPELGDWLDRGAKELGLLLPELASPTSWGAFDDAPGAEDREADERAGASGQFEGLFDFARDENRVEGSSGALDAARARFRQFDTLSRILRHVAGQAAYGAPEPKARALLIILDDLHAADEASVQLVRFLMPELRELGLFLVGTYRGLESGGKAALSALTESCRDDTLHLRGLSAADVSAWLESKLGPAPGRVSAALHEVSAGNPLLLTELGSQLAREHLESVEVAHLAEFALPERIRGAVRRHLRGLPGESRAALSAASVLGREFTLPILAQLLARSEVELLEALEPALRLGVVRPSYGPSRLLFSHALVRNAVYAELSVTARLDLHRRTAEILEAREPASRRPLHELAHHYSLAASHGCRDKALDYTLQAAEQAARVTAYESSAALYDRAVALADVDWVGGERLHSLLCSAAMAWHYTGDAHRAAALLERAADLARDERHALRFAEATMLMAWVFRGSVVLDGALQERLRGALALLPEGDSELRARLLSLKTLGMRGPATLEERQVTTQAAVDMARRLGDPHVLLWTLNARRLVLWGAAPAEEMILDVP